jgi:hypothetical protein
VLYVRIFLEVFHKISNRKRLGLYFVIFRIHANSFVFLFILLFVVFCCSIASMDGNRAIRAGEQANVLLPRDGKQAVPVPVPARGKDFPRSRAGVRLLRHTTKISENSIILYNSI